MTINPRQLDKLIAKSKEDFKQGKISQLTVLINIRNECTRQISQEVEYAQAVIEEVNKTS